MKKLILVLAVIAIAFASCSKDDDDDNKLSYTEKQEKALSVLNGSFKYENLLPDGSVLFTKKIEFGEQYSEPKKFYESESYIGVACGRCKLIDVYRNETENKFYFVDEYGIQLHIYNDVNGVLKGVPTKYSLQIISADEFAITKMDEIVPDIYKRIK